jgi:circadian clock protein KaiC
MDRRVSSGVRGLDEMLGGGFLSGSLNLVRGAPGVGKTSLALHFLIDGALRCRELGLLVSFEEFPRSLYRDAESLGLNLREAEEQGCLKVMFTSPEVLLASIEDEGSPINRMIVENDLRRLVIDSASHFGRLGDNLGELRGIHTSVTNGLRRGDVTTVLLAEEGRHDYHRVADGGLSFLVDGIILMRYVEVDSSMQRAVVVVKTRGSEHANSIMRYELGPGGMSVIEPFVGQEGLLSGISRRTLP